MPSLVTTVTALPPDLIALTVDDKERAVAGRKQAAAISQAAGRKQKIPAGRAAAANFQIQFAQIALAVSKAPNNERDRRPKDKLELDELTQRLKRVQSARANLVDLAKTQSRFPDELSKGELTWKC